MKKRLISLLAVLALIITLLPATAMAATFYMDLEAITSVDGKSISLDWDDDLNPPYSVQRRVAGSSSYTTVKSGIYNDEYVDASSKTMGKTYYYRIKDNAGNYSEEVPARTMAAPSYVKVTFRDNKAELSWPAGKYCDGYIVSAVSAMDDFDEIDLDELLDNMCFVEDTSFTYTNVSAEDMYVFMVMPIYQTSDGDLCYGEPMVGMEVPQLTVSKTDGKVNLKWNAVFPATKYYIYRGTSSDNLSYYDTTYKTSYTNSSVTSGTRYYYQVKAVCQISKNQVYNSAKSAVKSTIPLTTPSLTVSMSNGAAKLSWGKVTGATKYYIYRGTSSSNLSYYDSTTSTSYTNSSVTGGTTYYYKVKAVKTVSGTDWTSDYSSVKSVKILKTPVISVTKSNGKVTVSWDAVSGAAKYYIYRSTDGTNFKYYDSTTKTSYTNSSVTSGTKYYYKVKAVNADGGATKQSSAKSTVPVATPVLTSCAFNGSKVALEWNAVKGATKYWLYRSVDGGELKYYDSTTKTTYGNSSVTAGHSYSYYVKAVVTLNGSDWSSSPSQTMTAVVPGA